jgi:hypothetical protein
VGRRSLGVVIGAPVQSAMQGAAYRTGDRPPMAMLRRIQRVLERRARQPPSIQDDTTATISVMLRVLPPPKALLAIGDSMLRQQLERQLAAGLLEIEAVSDESEALELFASEFRPVILTDSLQLIRGLRARSQNGPPSSSTSRKSMRRPKERQVSSPAPMNALHAAHRMASSTPASAPRGVSRNWKPSYASHSSKIGSCQPQMI